MKTVTRRTIESNGFLIGKSIKCKGTELYAKADIKMTFGFYPDEKERDKAVEKFISKLKSFEKPWFVSGYSSITDVVKRKSISANSSFEDMDAMVNMDKIGFVEALLSNEEIYMVHISLKRPMFYLPVSKFGSDWESQRELAITLYNNTNKRVLEDDNDYIEFDSYTNRDFKIFHGGGLAALSPDLLEPIDGRIYEDETGRAIEQFWMDEEAERDYLDVLDPDQKVTVYHRKGKDWYISNPVEAEVLFWSFREDGELDEDSEEFFYEDLTATESDLTKIETSIRDTIEGVKENAIEITQELES